METPFDYSQCSLAELRDVQRHIDKAKYPAIYAALLQEIAQRENQPPETQQPEQQSSNDFSHTLRAALPFGVLILAGAGLYWGYQAAYLIHAHLAPAPGTRNELEPWFGVLLGSVCFFLSLLCLVPAVVYFYFMCRKK